MADITVTDNAEKDSQRQQQEEHGSTGTQFLSDSSDHDDDSQGADGEEYEIELAGSETPQPAPKGKSSEAKEGGEGNQADEKEQRRKSATLRLERKRQRELEEQAKAITEGNIPDHLKVKPDLPPQPDPKDYFNESALWDKYNGDQALATAAYNRDLATWSNQALDKRSESVALQGRKIQEFNEVQQRITQAASRHYDAAEKLASQYGLKDYEQVEETFRKVAPAGVDVEIMDFFPEKSPVLMYYLGKNPNEIQRIINLGPQRALIELTLLSERLSLKPKNQRSRAPEPDEPLTNGAPAGGRIENIRRKMEKASSDGNVTLYRELKQQLKQAEARKK